MPPQIDQFLAANGLSQYITLFRENDIEMQQLLVLTENDFEKLGITSFGHRKHLFDSIQKLIASIQEQYLEEKRAVSQHFAVKFLTGYAIVAVIGSIIAQIYAPQSESLTGSWFVDGLIIAAALVAFMSPTVIAWWRAHEYKWAILLGNIFLGGTGLGWVACLVFSFSVINPATAAVLALLSTRHRR